LPPGAGASAADIVTGSGSGIDAPADGRRVLRLLVVVALAVAFGLPFLTVASNRLMSGSGLALWTVLHASAAAPGLAAWGPGAVVALASTLLAALALWAPGARHADVAVAAAAMLLLAGLLWVAGDAAAARSAVGTRLMRVSFSGGFWCLALLAWLMAADGLQRLRLPLVTHLAAHAAVLAPLVLLLASGALDELSLLKEYANRQDVFHDAAGQHLRIVGAALLPALVIGVPLGLVPTRCPRVSGPLFAVLGIVQTVPSMALFGLLIAPLVWLAQWLPGWGIRGIGLLPATIALTLYALLPIVHGTASGLRQVPASVLDAAAGMGLTPRQRFWQVQVPLALPVLLAGLRVTAVQLVGLAVVAALIGAGGFGALMFQGLASSALDLVLLGVLPVVMLALVVDAGLRLLTAVLTGDRRSVRAAVPAPPR
jgi:osmoprotectant transport system permease protein